MVTYASELKPPTTRGHNGKKTTFWQCEIHQCVRQEHHDTISMRLYAHNWFRFV